jgi:GT2 family glycosyltransferase/glycosyltransferase involved in cell wall biosynthesis
MGPRLVGTRSAGNAAPDNTWLARDARERGQQALMAGDYAEAMRWLDRAHRLAPHDGTLTLTLATACLRSDNRRAASLYRSIAEAQDVREAWLGLAAASVYVGDTTGAANALADSLARHVPDAALRADGASLADVIVRKAGAAGWCGVTLGGQLVVRPAIQGEPEIRLDGRRCAAPALPSTWTRAAEITVSIGGRHLLGSPIQLGAIRRVAGFVEAHQGGLRGWAWHPADPDTDPVLLVRGCDGRGTLRITATDWSASVQHAVSLARPRGFAVSVDALARLSRPLQVLDRFGADVLGSPLDPGLEQSSATAASAALGRYLVLGSNLALGRNSSGGSAHVAPFPPPAIPADALPPVRAVGASRRHRQVAVVMPVYGGTATVLACLDSVLATVHAPHAIIVVDDGSPEQDLRRALDALAADGRIRLIRHARNQGFPASANDGIAAAKGRDVVLLNSDTLVPPGWLERLGDAAYVATGIGTATPLSNDASILSYPGPVGSNDVPDHAATLRLDAAARRANPGSVVDIPVGVGFCLYLRRDCLDAVGPFRADVFAQGYGEECDFCLRARHLGWRHVAVPGVFVAHVGGASFGQGGRHLQARNQALLNRLHPGYDRLIGEFVEADPLAEVRRRFDLVRWRADGRGSTGSAILITHNDGGGVERQVAVSAASHRAAGLRPVILRPAPDSLDDPAVVVDDAASGFPDLRFPDLRFPDRHFPDRHFPNRRFPNLRYALPREQSELLRLLRGTHPGLVEVHHTLHHPPAIFDLIARLGVPYDVHVHDYPWFCPQVSLVGADRRYCGEPAVAQCEACVADAGRVIDEPIGVRALRQRSAGFLAGARRVVTPSADAAARMRRHFPALRPIVAPLEDDAAIAAPPRPQARAGICRVCVLGAIGVHKGYDVLLACARDAAERKLPLEFVVVGHTIDDARLLATGRVFVTGRYAAEEAVPLVRAQEASLALMPSVWPETWSFGLTELWRAGLVVAAFDFGAPADRIRNTGRGLLLPVGLPARAINNAMVAAVGLTGHEGGRTVDDIRPHPSIQETSHHPWQDRPDSNPLTHRNQPLQ